jgi:hypothetical protein
MRRVFRRCCSIPVAVLSVCSVFGRCEPAQQMTPLLLEVRDAPVPFRGSDGLTHLVYELWLSNVSSGEAKLEDVEVMGDGAVLQTLDAAAVSQRLQPAGLRESSGVLAQGTQSILFLNVILRDGMQIPKQLSHQIKGRFSAAPPGQQELAETDQRSASWRWIHLGRVLLRRDSAHARSVTDQRSRLCGAAIRCRLGAARWEQSHL